MHNRYAKKQYNICSSKNRYESKEIAEQVCKEQIQLYNGIYLRVYGCHVCKGWHLTHHSEEEYKKKMENIETEWAEMLEGY